MIPARNYRHARKSGHPELAPGMNRGRQARRLRPWAPASAGVTEKEDWERSVWFVRLGENDNVGANQNYRHYVGAFLGTAAAAYSQGSMTQDLGKRRLGIHRLTGSAPIAPRRRPAATAHSVPATPRSRLDWH